MEATGVYRAMLKEWIGPALREQGFRGSGSTWRLTSPRGDVAVINAQSSRSSTKSGVSFVINLAVVPQPWWAWLRHKYPQAIGKSAMQYDGLWWDRLSDQRSAHPRGIEQWWSLHDAASAEACARDVIGRLRDEALPLLNTLLQRDHLKDALRVGDIGFPKAVKPGGKADRGLALLLADDGGGPELEDLIQGIRASAKRPTDRAERERFAAWLRTHAYG